MVLAVLIACGSGPRVTPAPPPPGADVATAPAPPAPAAPAPPKLVAVKRPVFESGAGLTVAALPAELPAEVDVVVIPLVDLPPAIARTVPTRDGKRRISTIEHATWKDFPALPGRSSTDPFDVVVLYPAVPGAKRVEPSTAAGLPETVTPATITAAIDRDGDGKADLLFTDWCCGAHTEPLKTGCEAECGELWALEGGTWTAVERAGANGIAK